MVQIVNQTEIIIKEILAEQLAVDVEQIESHHNFAEDLDMNKEDKEDFLENLASANFDTSELDLDVTETVGELVDDLTEK